jgi:heterodisulfide reductase subunit C
MARREGYSGERNMRLFADAFLQSVRMNGRAHELGLMAVFKLRTLKLFADLSLAPGMLLKGKLPFLPHKIKARSEVADIFRRFNEGRAEDAGGGKP